MISSYQAGINAGSTAFHASVGKVDIERLAQRSLKRRLRQGIAHCIPEQDFLRGFVEGYQSQIGRLDGLCLADHPVYDIDEIVRSQDWYVYTYSYVNGTIFYVGKGVGARIHSHEKEAASGCKCRKCCAIRWAWERDGSVIKDIVFVAKNEDDAVCREEEMLGDETILPFLTNTYYKRGEKWDGRNQNPSGKRTLPTKPMLLDS